jgi:hypothetical protein
MLQTSLAMVSAPKLAGQLAHTLARPIREILFGEGFVSPEGANALLH